MVKYTKRDREILITVTNILRDKKIANYQTVIDNGKNIFSNVKGWSNSLMHLVDKRLLKEKNGLYSFGAKGKLLATKFFKDYYRERYNRILLRFSHSKTYGQFCEQVFGMNLCQVSMMNMKQLHKLISLLQLGKDSKILDIGCGTGMITEYLYDVTGARIIGVDFADKVVKEAQRRSVRKKKFLSYKRGDMDNLNFQKHQFNVIISIDALYFVENLELTVKNLKTFVQPGGQMGIFYTQSIKIDGLKSQLYPRNTKLAQVLKKLHLDFRAYNFTRDEYKHWHKRIKVANHLKQKFKREGYLDLYNNIIREAQYVSKFVAAGRLCRYLYHVRV